MKKTILISILLLFLLAFNLYSQRNSDLHFRKIQVDDGLSENSIYCILQDTKGFMWFGTKDGLNRYDGNNFRIFRYDSNDSFSLGNNFIRSMVDRKDGYFYIGSDAGLYIMDNARETFTLFDMKSDNGEIINSAVNSLLIDKKGNLWIGTMHKGIFMYDIKKNILHNIPIKQYDLGINATWYIYEDMSGTIWAGTRMGLLRFNPDIFKFEAVDNLFAMVDNSDNEILSIYEDIKGNLWLGTWADGMRCYNKQSGSFTSYLNSFDKQFYITHIRSIFQYNESSLFIGSDDGLYLFDINDKTCRRLDITKLSSNLSDQNVYSIYRDRENGIWVGTYFGGINYLNTSLSATEFYYPYGMEYSLLGKAVSQFCEDDKGNFWIATEDGGVNYFDTKTKTFTQPIKTSYHNTHALLLDGDDLWIGTFSRGIDVYNTKTKEIINYQKNVADTTTLNDDCIFMLYKTKNGDIYAGTPIGLNIYNRKTKRFKHIKETQGFIYDMKEDEYGNLWIADYGNGVTKYDFDKDKWIKYDTIFSDNDPIVRSKLTSVYIDDQRRLWFSSEGNGIFLYDYKTDSFTNISESDGLPNNVVYGILDDRYGNLWISCNRGIVCFNPSNLSEYDLFGKEDGMQSNQFNYKSSYKASDGKFYFGGINGFNCFYSNELGAIKNHNIPFVEITELRLLNNASKENEQIIREAINTGTAIILPYNKASFTIDYVSTSYVSQAKNQYAYKLANVDTDWNYVGNNRSVTYINLAPGKYVFHVKASNNDNLWNEKGTAITIEILPPIWLSQGAKILYIILILGLIFFVIRYYVTQSRKRQNNQLQSFKAEQENLAFKSKIDFFTRIAHEIRTPLSLIKAPLEEIVNSEMKPDETKDNLYIIEKNCDRLSDLVNQILDFRKLDSAAYVLNPQKIDIKEHITELYQRFQKTAQSKNIDFELQFQDNISRQKIMIDADALIKIVGNLLTNALKFTKDKIVMRLEENMDNTFTISVQDNGKGIPDDLKNLIFDPFYQVHNGEENIGTGIGLSLVKHLTDILGGKILVNDNPTGGSIFSFTFSEIDKQESIVESSDIDMEKSENITISGNNKKQTLLFVDDNTDMIQFIQNSLQSQYEVETAVSAALAMKLVSQKFFDLIISDIMMPDIDGLEFVRMIRSDVNYSHIPIILLSAKTENSIKVEGLHSGANVFIEKPFSILYLRAQINSLLENRKAILETFNRSPLASYSLLATNKRDSEFLDRLNTEIENHLSDVDFSIESLTDILAISRSNLQRKIKSICDMTPVDYLRNYRLKKACKYLLETDMRINEVAYEVGFNSASYFTKCFIKQYGMLPKDFVKRNQGENQN